MAVHFGWNVETVSAIGTVASAVAAAYAAGVATCMNRAQRKRELDAEKKRLIVVSGQMLGELASIKDAAEDMTCSNDDLQMGVFFETCRADYAKSALKNVTLKQCLGNGEGFPIEVTSLLSDASLLIEDTCRSIDNYWFDRDWHLARRDALWKSRSDVESLVENYKIFKESNPESHTDFTPQLRRIDKDIAGVNEKLNDTLKDDKAAATRKAATKLLEVLNELEKALRK